MNQAGQKYVHSGAFNANRTLVYTFIGSLGAIILGWGYAALSRFNPLIYFNFIALAIVAAILVFITGAVGLAGKIRNIIINTIQALFISLVAWYAQWAFYLAAETSYGLLDSLIAPSEVLHYASRFSSTHSYRIGRFGSDGLEIGGFLLAVFEVIEFAAFMTPVYFNVAKFKEMYFCENCYEFNISDDYYADEIRVENETDGMIAKGNLSFLKNVEMYASSDELHSDPSTQATVHKISLSNCKVCNDNAIIDISNYILKYDDKKKRELSDESRWIGSLYINDETRDLFPKVKGTGGPPTKLVGGNKG